jgi:hypothetical protein
MPTPLAPNRVTIPRIRWGGDRQVAVGEPGGTPTSEGIAISSWVVSGQAPMPGWFQVLGPRHIIVFGFVLFGWGDGGPAYRSAAAQAVVSGVPPGERIAFSADVVNNTNARGKGTPGLTVGGTSVDLDLVTQRVTVVGAAGPDGTVPIQLSANGYGGTQNLTLSVNNMTWALLDDANGERPAGLEFWGPLAQARAWSQPGPGSEVLEIESGEEDAWVEDGPDGMDQLLDGVVQYIPAEDGIKPDGLPVSGWNGPAGWDAFLRYARDGGAFDYYPDREDDTTRWACQLVAPLSGAPADANQLRRLTLRMRRLDGLRFPGF